MPLRFVLGMLLMYLTVCPSMCAEADGAAFFENKVRPLLIEHCYKCHSVSENKHKGGLLADSLEALLKGGEDGPALVPGKPGQSKMIEAVNYKNADLKMPPKGKLSDAQIATLTAWVQMGAPWPKTAAAAQAAVTQAPVDPEKMRRMAEHWAWKAPQVSALPAVKNEAWVRSPIDRFILAKLEAGKLAPAPGADKRTLIRRANFDLVGLPPAPEEVDAFLADDSSGAFAKVLDRLLASPQYGERWGRHWLDLARYAESNGMDENLAYGNAYRYRDYVVSAFNRDLPYDQFLREQVAGDLMPVESDPAETRQRQIATGFLALGPKVLAEPDSKKMEMDIVDEELDTLGRSVMGLTMGCARCHDHKFDPIPTADYYSLAAILKSTRTMENYKKVARWYERPLGTKEEMAALDAQDKVIKAKKEQVDKETKLAKDIKPDNLKKESAEKLKALKAELAALEKARPNVSEAMGAAEGDVVETLRIHIRGSPQTLGAEVPKRFPQILGGEKHPPIQARQSGRLQLANWLTRPEHPLTARVMANRIWRWHFGTGIVGTTDNFGLLGEKPSHPELLDWLALEFVKQGWSVKALHRAIMLSTAYQMSCADSAAAEATDPENRLHWRFSRQRLEAETIRDAILAASGTLDLKMGGTLLKDKNRAYIKNDNAAHAERFDNSRRSIYLPVIRTAGYDVFQAFDFPDPCVSCGNRSTTTVAPQALFMLNGDVVVSNAKKMGELVMKQTGDDAARVRFIYLRAFSRLPAEAEAKRALKFVADYTRAFEKGAVKPVVAEPVLRAWQAFCQSVMASNEFVYVD